MAFHLHRRNQAARAVHQDHLRPAGKGFPGQGKAHLSGGAVGQHAHRIDMLPGASGGDQHRLSLQALRMGMNCPVEMLNLIFQPRQASHPAVALRQEPFFRVTDAIAPIFQGGDISLHRRIQPHIAVHRRGKDRRAVQGQQVGREEIIPDPVGHLADDVGGRRNDDHRLRPVGQLDMMGGGIAPFRKHLGVDRVIAERFNGQAGDKFLPVGGHHRPHMGALGHQVADQFTTFIGGDPPGNAYQDIFTFQAFGRKHISLMRYDCG